MRIFCGNHRVENNRSMVADLVQSHTAVGCNMALEVRLFHRLSFRLLPRKSRGSKQFYLNISTKKKQYQGKWSSRILADYCRTLREEVPQEKYSRTSFSVTVK
jgi:hypothetical protein